MGRGRELSPQMRSRICELHSCGYSYKRIHEIHREIPYSTIRTTCQREASRINNCSRPRPGAPRKLTEEQRDQIYDTVTYQNPHISHKDLLVSVDNAVKERSLRYLLRELGRRKWLQLKRPMLTEDHARQRREWVEHYEHFTLEDWKHVKWTDECTVERGTGIRPVWTFLRPREQLEQRDIREVRCGKGVKQMLWAGFGFGIRTNLIPLDGDPLSARGGVSGRTIRQLYFDFLPDFVRPGDIFMHDNAPVHTARIVRALLQELGIQVMIWPPYSPDLNPIENLWTIMKAEIYRLEPDLEHAADTIETLRRLIITAKQAWAAIDQAVLDQLASTMPHRVEAVKKADGWYTKY